MQDSPHPMELDLIKKALRRRRASPHDYRGLSDDALLGIYTEAASILMKGTVGPDAGAKWAHVIRLIDEYDLLRMGRAADDPHPFTPLLQLVVRLRALADSPELRAAHRHLRSIAQSLLDAQGCSKVRPEDLINRQLPVVSAIKATFYW